MIGRDPWLIDRRLSQPAASLAHLACIVGGPDWYRFFGAGRRHRAGGGARRVWTPHLITVGIAAMLAIWAAYAFSGAGLIGACRCSHRRSSLITAVYLLRGLVVVAPSRSAGRTCRRAFMLWSSLIVLGYRHRSRGRDLASLAHASKEVDT